MLAIHLDREVNTRGLILNPQSQLNPTWSLELDTKRHCFVDVLCQELGRHGDRIDPEAVIAYDLCLFDCQPPALGGAYGELIFSARLDNLASCHAATRALVESETTTEMTRVLALYDHEEVGSQSASGARSLLLSNTLERIATSYPEATAQTAARAFARSLFVSCDMAHAVNPNYVDRHDKQHRPKLAHGPVIKSNVNQAYATDAPGAALFAAACREVGAPAQYFVSRNDMGCGSTIGPISAARTGIRTIDVGNPMLSMHSCREVAAVQDVAPMIGVLKRMLSESRPPPPKV
jgi:aspartyl aminopeptidase